MTPDAGTLSSSFLNLKTAWETTQLSDPVYQNRLEHPMQCDFGKSRELGQGVSLFVEDTVCALNEMRIQRYSIHRVKP